MATDRTTDAPEKPVANPMAVSPAHATPLRYVLRFHYHDRLIHGVLMASFLTLALTGIPLLFPMASWARVWLMSWVATG